MAWATDLRLKYLNDIFFRTRVKIISFVILLTVLSTVTYFALLMYVKRDILVDVVDALTRAIASPELPREILFETDSLLNNETLLSLGLIALLSIIAGLLVSRLALQPVSRALQLQKKFILSAAHELRTPLAVLKTNNEVMLLENHLAPTTRELLLENIEDINHINEILSNLLLFNHTDAQNIIKMEEVNLESLLEKVRGDLHQLAQGKNVRVISSGDPIPTVHGNPIALEQAFFNLIKNAIIYTQPRGEIHIMSSRTTEHTVSIKISDTGIGIPPDDLPHIFEHFFRSGNAEKRTRGTGLGLTLVYEIVKIHQGKIEVQSVEEEGTSFIITLPRHATILPKRTLPDNDATLRLDFSAR